MPELVSTLSKRPVAWMALASLLALALAGCVREPPNDMDYGWVEVERVDPSQEDEESVERAQQIDSADAEQKAPALVEALRKAKQGEIQYIAGRENQDAAIDYLEKISGGRLPHLVKFEGDYFKAFVGVA